MTDTAHLHYLNADFDLSLQAHPQVSATLERQVRELSVQALIGADSGDAVWVRAEVPSEFTAYLADNGVPVPEVLPYPQIDPARRLQPFGWNREAIEQNDRYPEPVSHPPLSVIRRVNSRSFSCGLQAELFSDEPSGSLIQSAAQLETFLAGAPMKREWVIKAEHGNAGMGNRRLHGVHLSGADRRWVDLRLIQDDRLVIERWLERTCDLSMVFDVPFDLSRLRIHETFCTDGGALVGSIFDPEGQVTLPDATWHALAGAADRMAARLDDEGYFGPVCVDAFEWRDGDRLRVRSFVDLNARQSMTAGAYRLWQRLMPDRTFFYRFFSSRKLTGLPGDFGSAIESLGRYRYDPSRRCGILLASPVRVGFNGEMRTPGKLTVIFAEETRSGVFALERWFRSDFEV